MFLNSLTTTNKSTIKQQKKLVTRLILVIHRKTLFWQVQFGMFLNMDGLKLSLFTLRLKWYHYCVVPLASFVPSCAWSLLWKVVYMTLDCVQDLHGLFVDDNDNFPWYLHLSYFNYFLSTLKAMHL